MGGMCNAMAWHAATGDGVPCHAMVYQTPCHATPSYAQAVPCNMHPRHAMPCCVMTRHGMLCNQPWCAMPWQAIACPDRAMHSTPCHATACHGMTNNPSNSVPHRNMGHCSMPCIYPCAEHHRPCPQPTCGSRHVRAWLVPPPGAGDAPLHAAAAPLRGQLQAPRETPPPPPQSSLHNRVG